MQLQQSPENIRALAESLQRATLQAGTSIQRKHQPRHEQRSQRKPPMLVLIASQVPCPQAIGQHHRLAESEAESFARDRIDCARGISNQSHITPAHAFQLERGRQRAFLHG